MKISLLFDSSQHSKCLVPPNANSARWLDVFLGVRTFLRCLVEGVLQANVRLDFPTSSFEPYCPGYMACRINLDLLQERVNNNTEGAAGHRIPSRSGRVEFHPSDRIYSRSWPVLREDQSRRRRWLMGKVNERKPETGGRTYRELLNSPDDIQLQVSGELWETRSRDSWNQSSSKRRIPSHSVRTYVVGGATEYLSTIRRCYERQ